jgi:azurin
VKSGNAVITAALLATAAPAFAAPVFRAEVEGNKLVVFSTSDVDIACYTFITFSYQRGDKRETSRFVCNTFARAQKDFRFCERADEKYIDLKIEGPVTASC